MEKQRRIFEYVTTELNPKADVAFDPDVNLLESGVLESMMMIELIVWLEETFGVEIETEDLTPDNFSSLNAMVTYLEGAAAAG